MMTRTCSAPASLSRGSPVEESSAAAFARSARSLAMASMTVRLPSREGWHEVAKTQNYSAETRAKAIRLVRAHAGDYPSEYAAITAVASRLGMTAETLRKWIRQAEVDRGERPGGDYCGVPGDPPAPPQGGRAGAHDRDLVGDGFLRAGARPATGLICQFIDAFRHRFGVVPICRALSAQGLAIAPRTYRARKQRPPSARSLRDAVVTTMLAGIFEPGTDGRRAPESLYGAVKARGWPRRGVAVARARSSGSCGQRLAGQHPPRPEGADDGP